MVATLRYQAEARRTDLLWEPVDRARAVLDVVDRVKPDQVIVDHLAFSARLALAVAGVPHADVVLGHPSALPVGDEVYGYPPAWPAAFTAPEADSPRCTGCAARCGTPSLPSGTPPCACSHPVPRRRWTRSPSTGPADAELPGGSARPGTHGVAATARVPRLGRAGRAGGRRRPGLARGRRPAGGLRQLRQLPVGARGRAGDGVDALRPLGLRVAVATGSATGVPDVPPDWLVRPYLPQVALLQRTAVLVTHGGNNSVTEALTAGVPMVVLPFSTDQFAGAAAIEAAGLGRPRPERGHVRGTGYRRGRRPRRPCPAPGPHDRRGATPGTGRDVARAALLESTRGGGGHIGCRLARGQSTESRPTGVGARGAGQRSTSRQREAQARHDEPTCAGHPHSVGTSVVRT